MSKSKIEICLRWEADEGLYFADMSVNETWGLDNDGMNDVYEAVYGVANKGWQHPFIHNARYAVLIGGGGIHKE